MNLVKKSQLSVQVFFDLHCIFKVIDADNYSVFLDIGREVFLEWLFNLHEC